MKINLKKQKSIRYKKDGTINPHRFWLILITIFIIILTLEIVYFTYFFTVSTKKLDEQVVPKLDTNSLQINKLEKLLDSIEGAINTRTK